MIPKSVDELIHKYTDRVTVKLLRDARKLTMIFMAVSLCFLLTMKAFIISAILFVGSIVLFVYSTRVIKSGVLTVYNGVLINAFFFFSLVVSLDAGMCCMQVSLGTFSIIMLTAILLIQLASLFAGFLYTIRRVEKGAIKKSKTTAVTAGFYASIGISGYCLAKGISAIASDGFKNVFFTVVLAFGASMMMFAIGMAYLSIIYYVRKYKIADRPIGNSGEGNADV